MCSLQGEGEQQQEVSDGSVLLRNRSRVGKARFGLVRFEKVSFKKLM